MVSFDRAAEDCQSLFTSRRTIERHVSLDVYAAEPAMTDAALIAAARAVAARVYPDMIVRPCITRLARSRPRTPQLAEISSALSGSNPGKPRRAVHGPSNCP